MPRRPKHLCRQIGCPNLCEPGHAFCPEHEKAHPLPRWYTPEQQKVVDRERGGSTARGYDSRWRRVRLSFLASHPLCVECLKRGRYTKATVVDHIIPHRGDKALFWDSNNWQALCKPCHDRKTASGQ